MNFYDATWRHDVTPSERVQIANIRLELISAIRQLASTSQDFRYFSVVGGKSPYYMKEVANTRHEYEVKFQDQGLVFYGNIWTVVMKLHDLISNGGYKFMGTDDLFEINQPLYGYLDVDTAPINIYEPLQYEDNLNRLAKSEVMDETAYLNDIWRSNLSLPMKRALTLFLQSITSESGFGFGLQLGFTTFYIMNQ